MATTRGAEKTPGAIPTTMKAVVTTGSGGYDRLVYQDVPVPELEAGEVLVQVLAAGVNNTEINTRLGWYSAAVTSSTEDAANSEHGRAAPKVDGGWNESTPFPLIQGTDCCGRVVAVAPDVDGTVVGARVLVRPCMRPSGFESIESTWMGSDFDGAFAQYVAVPAAEVFPVDCDWADSELGSIPCAYGTSENMLHRAQVGAVEHVLVTGASGGVGSATVQLAKRRGATVIAVCSESKMDAVRALGADTVIPRGADLVASLGAMTIDVAIDNVAGPSFGHVLEVLKRGGRYASSGAIGGPLVEFDVRTFYLKDLTMIGCTAWDEPVFQNLVSYVERDEIRPVVSGTFPLDQIVVAQQKFLEKRHVGKFVLVP